MGETKPKPVCERCGAVAIVHIRPNAADAETVYHFCLTCADAVAGDYSRDDLPDQHRRNRAALFVLVGLIVLVLSVGADFFHFGQAEGFGWKQMTGLFCGIALVVLGSIIRSQTVALTGLIMGGLTLLADWLGFGSSPGIGWQQMAGILLGTVLVLAGLYVTRRRWVLLTPPTNVVKQRSI